MIQLIFSFPEDAALEEFVVLSFSCLRHSPANTKLNNAIAAKPLTNLFTFIDSHLFFHDFHKHQKFVIHYTL